MPGRVWLRPLSDEQLARRAAAGSEWASEAIARRYRGALVRYCYSILFNADDAEDAAQSALMSALRSLRQTEPQGALRPWLYRIAHNESVDLLRRRRSQEQLAAPAALTAPAAEDEAVARELVGQLFSDLEALSERQRAALVLREFGGLGYREIAAIMDGSTASARQTVLEARAALHEFAEGRDMSCAHVRRALAGGDGRRLRGRRLRAHLSWCADCRSLEAARPRKRGLRVLVPLFPAPLRELLGALSADAPQLKAAAASLVLVGGASGLGLHDNGPVRAPDVERSSVAAVTKTRHIAAPTPAVGVVRPSPGKAVTHAGARPSRRPATSVPSAARAAGRHPSGTPGKRRRARARPRAALPQRPERSREADPVRRLAEGVTREATDGARRIAEGVTREATDGAGRVVEAVTGSGGPEPAAPGATQEAGPGCAPQVIGLVVPPAGDC